MGAERALGPEAVGCPSIAGRRYPREGVSTLSVGSPRPGDRCAQILARGSVQGVVVNCELSCVWCRAVGDVAPAMSDRAGAPLIPQRGACMVLFHKLTPWTAWVPLGVLLTSV